MERKRLLSARLWAGFVAGLLLTIFILQYNAPTVHRQRLNQALQDAIWHNDAPGVTSALAAGADPNASLELVPSDEQREPFLSRLRERLRHQAPPPDVETPLAMEVGYYGHLPNGRFDSLPENTAIVRALLDRGARPDNDVPEVKMPVLAAAALEGRNATVQLLLAHGADSSARDGTGMGWTALIEAAAEGKAAAVRSLLDGGADANVASRDGTTALIMAVSVPEFWPHFRPNDGLTTIRLLLGHHADVRFRDQTGDTALVKAKRIMKRRPQDAPYLSQVIALLQAAPAARH